MPEPINYCPAPPMYSHGEEPELSSPSNATDSGSGGVAQTSAQAQKANDAPSCLGPALTSVAACGSVVLTAGTAALLAGAGCVGALIAFDNCLDAQKKAAESPH